jgi:hypothetical protein
LILFLFLFKILENLLQAREKASASIAPVIDLSDKHKSQMQLRKDVELSKDPTTYPFYPTHHSASNNEIRFNSLTGKVNKIFSN